ncbi:hypothetical protein KP509_1Z202200 [Ceratopteris richardii]|nr:hypothetical protein KP509_1Z202200 [Ceratopteris richardii]
MSPLRAILMRRPSRGLFKAYLNAEFNGYRKFITQILPPQVMCYAPSFSLCFSSQSPLPALSSQVRVVDAEKTYPKIPTEDIKKSYPDKTIIINDIDDIFLSAAPPQKLSQAGPFKALVSQLMSARKEDRGQAEQLFNLCRDKQLDIFLLKLILAQLNVQTKGSIKEHILFCIQQEENQSVLKKLCDTVTEVAGNVVEDASWVELLPFLFQCVNSNVNRLEVSALLIFGQLAQHMGPQLQPHLSTLHALFQQTLSPSMPNDVRSTSLWAVAYFVKTLDSAKDRNIFQDLLPAMMQTVTQALEMHEEATTQDALEMLIEIAGSEPQFIRKQLKQRGWRKVQAVEFRISLTEARERAPGMMRKLPHMKQLADYIVPALVDSLRKEPDMEVLIDMLISLNECLKIAASLIDPAQIKGMVDELQQAHTASSTRKKERAEHSHAEELDAEERSEPQFIRKQLVSVVGSILQIVEAEGLEESTQCLAVEFRISLTEARERAPGMMRKLPHMKQLADYIVPALVDSLRKEPDMEVLIDMLISLNECLKIAASLIDPAQIKGMVDELQQAHTPSSTRKKERAEHSHAEELDAEESEIIQKENDVQNLMSQFTKCVFLCFPMLQITWPMKILRRQVILFQLI